MKAGSGILQGTDGQVVETTWGILPSNEIALENLQTGVVTKNGSAKEKKSQKLFEAICLGVALLSLFLMGCSGSLVAHSRSTDTGPIVELSGEANIPPTLDDLEAHLRDGNASVTDSSKAEKQTLALRGFIQQDAVADRVRVVTGWLRFTSQNKAAERIETGWARVNSGQIFGTLNTKEVPERPELSRRELMLWRQLVLENAADADVDPRTSEVRDLKSEFAKRREALAILLTVAKTPDDLMRADELLVVPETLARY